MRRPLVWVGFSIALVFLFCPRLPGGSSTTDEIGMPGFSQYSHPVTQTLLLAVRTAEWQTVESGLLEVSELAPPQSSGSLVLDGESLSDAMTDPQTFGFLPAGTEGGHATPAVGAVVKAATSVSPSLR